jgi:hypothetical protein
MSIDNDRGEPVRPTRRDSGATGQQALEELLQAAPGLARIAANMARQGASEIANAYVEGASRVVRRAGRPGLHDDRRGGRLPPRRRVYAYLNNLNRLGLVWFSREALRDARRYQVLEAQSKVTDALEKGGRTARTVRRSIVLTPFGEDFCAICLPLD